MDELVIVATAIVFLVAGYDTTGTTLAFVCYQLAKNPDIQDKLRAEVLDTVEDPSAKIKYEDLMKMTYLDQIISETLRFHNPAALVQRVTLNDYKVPGHDLTIEKGTQVWVNCVSIHYNKEHYANPNTFDPDHFSKEAKASRNP